MQQQQFGVVPPPPGPSVVFVPSVPTSRPKVVDGYLEKQSIGLGVTQILLGILCIVCNSVAIAISAHVYNDDVAFVGHGIWNGILFVITGALGVLAGKSKTRCKIVAFMVMCIISASFTVGLMTVGMIGAMNANPKYNSACNRFGYSYDCDYYYDGQRYICIPFYYPPCKNTSAFRAIVAMEAIMAICALIESVVAIWGSVNCCKAVCCCAKPTSQTARQPANYIPNYYGQMIYVGQNQTAVQFYPAAQNTMFYQQGMSTSPSPYIPGSYGQPAWNQPPMLPVSNISNGPTGGQTPPPVYPSTTEEGQANDLYDNVKVNNSNN